MAYRKGFDVLDEVLDVIERHPLSGYYSTEVLLVSAFVAVSLLRPFGRFGMAPGRVPYASPPLHGM